MKAATLFSGIGAPEQARLDWSWLWSAEIDPFASVVLAARHPHSVNLGNVAADDFAERALAVGRPDIIVFGSPCQSFSVAGKRLGLDDPRGNLALVALEVVRRVRPRWFLFENVPGLLSSEGGRDFAVFLSAVAECGYLGCWRNLDAQFFGLAQRRERVFFVGCLGDWRGPAAVLFEREGLQGHPAPCREAGEGTARPLAGCPAGGSGYRNDADTAENLIPDIAGPLSSCGGTERKHGHGWGQQEFASGYAIPVANCLNAHGGSGRMDGESETFVPVALNWQSGGYFRPGLKTIASALQREQTQAVCFTCKDSGADAGDLAPTLRAMGHDGSWENGGGQVAVAFHENQRGELTVNDTAGSLKIGGGKPGQGYSAVAYDIMGIPATNGAKDVDVHTPLRSRASGQSEASTTTVIVSTAVRRLTPRECERLQGFPDVRKELTIRVCRNADEKRELARSAAHSSAAQNRGASARALVRVQIDLERQRLQLHSPGRSIWSASIADEPNSSPLSMPLGAFARLVARTLLAAGAPIHVGEAASLQSIKPSTVRSDGSAYALLSGEEIAGLASDAAKFTEEVSRCMKFITSPVGPSSPNSELSWQTCCCCVVAAISGFIPAEILSESSFDLSVETVEGYTLVSYRKKPAKDGNRYRALGNSMAVPVLRWLLTRVEAVDRAFLAQRARAAA